MEKNEVDKKLAQIGKDRHWLADQTGYAYTNLRNSLAPKAPDLSFAMSRKIEEAFEAYERAAPESNSIKCHPTTEELTAWQNADLVEGDHFTDFAIARINKLAESINALDELCVSVSGFNGD